MTIQIRSRHARELKTANQTTIMFGVLLLLASLCMLIETFALVGIADANKARHAAEKTAFVCFDQAGKVAVGDYFSHCDDVTYRLNSTHIN